MRYQPIKRIAILGLAITGLASLPNARADILPSPPLLPPVIGGYVSAADYHAKYDNILRLDSVFHYGFLQQFAPPPNLGDTDTHSFAAFLNLEVSVYSEGNWVSLPPISGVPNWTTVSITNVGPGDYSTEMTALDVSIPWGTNTIMIRESPTLSSLGHTTLTPITGGYTVDSFFDIFTELSLDDGDTWIPSDQSVLVEYECPEPASTALLGIGLAGLVVMYRRGRKA